MHMVEGAEKLKDVTRSLYTNHDYMRRKLLMS